MGVKPAGLAFQVVPAAVAAIRAGGRVRKDFPSRFFLSRDNLDASSKAAPVAKVKGPKFGSTKRWYFISGRPGRAFRGMPPKPLRVVPSGGG
jgi:hypothetical protein